MAYFRDIRILGQNAPYVLDGVLEQETHQQPQELITDTDGYSDIMFGLFSLLGYRFSPGWPIWVTLIFGGWTASQIMAFSTTWRGARPTQLYLPTIGMTFCVPPDRCKWER